MSEKIEEKLLDILMEHDCKRKRQATTAILALMREVVGEDWESKIIDDGGQQYQYDCQKWGYNQAKAEIRKKLEN